MKIATSQRAKPSAVIITDNTKKKELTKDIIQWDINLGQKHFCIGRSKLLPLFTKY
jgi:hypothetical protein